MGAVLATALPARASSPGLPRRDPLCECPAMWLKNFYAFAEIDRAAHRRREEAWLTARLADSRARFLPVWRAQNLVLAGAEPPRAAFLRPDELACDLAEAVLLGLAGEDAVFALDLSAHDEPLATLRHGRPVEFVDLRRIGALIDRVEGSL